MTLLSRAILAAKPNRRTKYFATRYKQTPSVSPDFLIFVKVTTLVLEFVKDC